MRPPRLSPASDRNWANYHSPVVVANVQELGRGDVVVDTPDQLGKASGILIYLESKYQFRGITFGFSRLCAADALRALLCWSRTISGPGPEKRPCIPEIYNDFSPSTRSCGNCMATSSSSTYGESAGTTQTSVKVNELSSGVWVSLSSHSADSQISPIVKSLRLYFVVFMCS